MERSEWLKKMRTQAEKLYDSIAPAYWVTFGFYANAAHLEYLKKFLERLPAHSSVLDTACGAGRYDGFLAEAGHTVLGVDQSDGILARAREHFPLQDFPTISFEKMGMQELNFQQRFDGLICMDALENLPPEDWPGVLSRFQKALKPGGVLYVTVEMAEEAEIQSAYEDARAKDLPVVFGEMVYKFGSNPAATPELLPEAGDLANMDVYHFYPRLSQVHAWFDQAGLVIESEGTGDEYFHILASARDSTAVH